MSTNEPVKILVVEDHEIIRVAVQRMLEKSTDLHIVGHATDGESAVNMARQLVPDIVLMDIGLPVMDGIAATRAIKETHRRIKILILTAYDSDDYVFGAFGAGADGYCIKTTRFDQLKMAILSVAAGAAWLDPIIAGRVLSAIPIGADAHNMIASKKTVTVEMFGLTPRELEVLELITQGLSNQEIAAILIVSLDTVKTHIRNIMSKLSVSDRTQAAVKAVRHGLAGLRERQD